MSKRKVTAAVNEMFSGVAPAKSTRGDKQYVPFPEELEKFAEVLCAIPSAEKTIKKQGDLAQAKCGPFMRKWWCQNYAETGTLPSQATFTAGDASLDYTLTSRIPLTDKKVSQMKEVGVDLQKYITVNGFEVNVKALAKLNYLDRFKKLIAEMVTDPEHVSQILTPKVSLKKGVLEDLPKMAQESSLDGPLGEQLETIVEILNPVPQKRNGTVDGLDSVDCFDRVASAKLDSEEA